MGKYDAWDDDAFEEIAPTDEKDLQRRRFQDRIPPKLLARVRDAVEESFLNYVPAENGKGAKALGKRTVSLGNVKAANMFLNAARDYAKLGRDEQITVSGQVYGTDVVFWATPLQKREAKRLPGSGPAPVVLAGVSEQDDTDDSIPGDTEINGGTGETKKKAA